MSFRFLQKAFYNYDSKHFYPCTISTGKSYYVFMFTAYLLYVIVASIVIIKNMPANLSHLHITVTYKYTFSSVSYVF